jgi:hypothetical protein
MLRSIGHVFEKVDCDTPEKKKWCKAKWPDWKNEAIFRDFIEPNRNRLLKEFKGGLTLKTPGVGLGAVVAAPGNPEGVSFLADLDVTELRDGEGRLVLDLFKQALSFWERKLKEAEPELKALP